MQKMWCNIQKLINLLLQFDFKRFQLKNAIKCLIFGIFLDFKTEVKSPKLDLIWLTFSKFDFK